MPLLEFYSPLVAYIYNRYTNIVKVGSHLSFVQVFPIQPNTTFMATQFTDLPFSLLHKHVILIFVFIVMREATWLAPLEEQP